MFAAQETPRPATTAHFPVPAPNFAPSLGVPAPAEGHAGGMPLPAALARAVERRLLARAFRGDPLVLAASRAGCEPGEVMRIVGGDRELAADALVLADGVDNEALVSAIVCAFPDVRALLDAIRSERLSIERRAPTPAHAADARRGRMRASKIGTPTRRAQCVA